MRLLYLHNQFFRPNKKGGQNTTLLQVFSMCDAFSKAGLEVTLAMEGDLHFKNHLEQFVQNSFNGNISFEVISWRKAHPNRLLNRILTKSKIVGIAKKQKPSLIFTREPYILDGLVKLDIPVIFESHNNKQHNRIGFIHKYLNNKIKRTSKSNNFICLFSISEALSNYWKNQSIPIEKLFSYHDGFDKNLFNEYLSKDEAREKLNLPIHKSIITYTGGLYQDREIENILDLAKIFPDSNFIIIGGPEKNREYYDNLAQENLITNIQFLGFQKHISIPNYLFASDVLLGLWSSKVPTINFCSPLKIFEYMAAGRTILAHSFPTIKEVLINEEDAFLCQPDSFISMKNGLIKAIDESKENTMGKKVRAKAFKYYSWDNRVNSLMHFLNIETPS